MQVQALLDFNRHFAYTDIFTLHLEGTRENSWRNTKNQPICRAKRRCEQRSAE